MGHRGSVADPLCFEDLDDGLVTTVGVDGLAEAVVVAAVDAAALGAIAGVPAAVVVLVAAEDVAALVMSFGPCTVEHTLLSCS